MLFGDMGLARVRIVVNRVRRGMMDKGYSVNIDRAMDDSGLSLLGVVPDDPDIIACGNQGRVLALCSDGGGQAAYDNIARRLLGRRVPLFSGVKVRR